jgi:S-DNA-T family DNA segregation ATPase FtsK/SpoIIIE
MVTISMPADGPTWRERMDSFVRRSGAMAAALGLLAVTLAFAFAMASYHATDPSLNTAAEGPARNLLGVAGAWTADILLSVFGPAIALALALPLLIACGAGPNSNIGVVTLVSSCSPLL